MIDNTNCLSCQIREIYYSGGIKYVLEAFTAFTAERRTLYHY